MLVISLQLWSEEDAWIDIMEFVFTTILPPRVVARTYYNPVNKPACLFLPRPRSMHDFQSLHYTLCNMYTTMELRNNPSLKKQPINRTEYYNVMVYAGNKKNTGKKVDVFLTLLGWLHKVMVKRINLLTNYLDELYQMYLSYLK